MIRLNEYPGFEECYILFLNHFPHPHRKETDQALILLLNTDYVLAGSKWLGDGC